MKKHKWHEVNHFFKYEIFYKKTLPKARTTYVTTIRSKKVKQKRKWVYIYLSPRGGQMLSYQVGKKLMFGQNKFKTLNLVAYLLSEPQRLNSKHGILIFFFIALRNGCLGLYK